MAMENGSFNFLIKPPSIRDFPASHVGLAGGYPQPFVDNKPLYSNAPGIAALVPLRHPPGLECGDFQVRDELGI